MLKLFNWFTKFKEGCSSAIKIHIHTLFYVNRKFHNKMIGELSNVFTIVMVIQGIVSVIQSQQALCDFHKKVIVKKKSYGKYM